MAVDIRGAARCSIGFRIPAKSLELQHTIRLIRELDAEIEEIEAAIQTIMDELHSPIATIPGNGCRMDAMILAGIGDFSRFDSPSRLLAYAGMSPSTYLSGQLKNCYPHMEKHSSGICAMPSTMPPKTGTAHLRSGEIQTALLLRDLILPIAIWGPAGPLLAVPFWNHLTFCIHPSFYGLASDS